MIPPFHKSPRPFLLLAFVGLLFFADLVLHPGQVFYSEHSDFLSMHVPTIRFLVRSWQETGALPLWCPYSFAGRPLLHDGFYPLHWPLLLLPEDWIGTALSWLLVGHVILGGGLMFIYARSQGLGETAALAAGCGYMLGGKWLLHLLAAGHYFPGIAWLPLVLLLQERALRRRSFLFATLAGVVFGLVVLGAHLQWGFYSGLFIALWTLGTALEESGYLGGYPESSPLPRTRGRGAGGEGEEPREILPLRPLTPTPSPTALPRSTGGEGLSSSTLSALGYWLGFGAWTATLGVCLASVQILPVFAYAASSSRAGGVSASDLLELGRQTLFSLVGPALVARPATQLWEERGGLGLLWLAAATLAPALCPRPVVQFRAAITLLLFLFAMGGALGLQWLPGFSLSRQPSRMLLVASLPVAYLAGVTVQALGERLALETIRSARKVLLGLILIVVVGVGSWAVLLVRGGFELRFHVYWVTLLVTVPALFWLLRADADDDRVAPRRAGLFALLLVIDLWALAWDLVDVRPTGYLYAPPSCVQFLREREPARILDRELDVHKDLSYCSPLGRGASQALVYSLEPLRGYTPLDVRRYKEYLQMVAGVDRPLVTFHDEFSLTFPLIPNLPVRHKVLLDLLGTRYLLQPSVESSPGPGWRAVNEDPVPWGFDSVTGGRQELVGYTVYENEAAFPRAFVVHEAEPLPDPPARLPKMTTTDFRRTVLLENFEGGQRETINPTSPRRVRIVRYLPNEVSIEVAAGPAGYLVLTDVWFPGWKCTVNGRPVEIQRANFLFRAVEVPADPVEVVFTFEPSSFRLGQALSGAAVLVVVIVLVASGLHWFMGGRG